MYRVPLPSTSCSLTLQLNVFVDLRRRNVFYLRSQLASKEISTKVADVGGRLLRSRSRLIFGDYHAQVPKHQNFLLHLAALLPGTRRGVKKFHNFT